MADPNHSYPSPQMQPTYAYPPPQGGHGESYRASPTGSSMPLPSINLPSIRHIDGQPQQQQPAPSQQQPPPSQMPPQGLAQMSAYYGHQSLPPPGHPMNVTSQPYNAAMRYPLPAQAADQRIMSGGRHKKEIKRRTKTGCLTCRKRRIKCDEQHPVCRNCQKSKRECLGYDPIFKQQPGPPSIQPAPSASPAAASAPATATPAAAPQYSNVPQGYAPAASGGYAPGQAAGTPGSSSDNNYDYASAIDPALAGSDSNAMSAHPSYDPNLRAAPNAGPYPPTDPSRKARPINIQDCFSLGGIPPPPPLQSTGQLDSNTVDAIRLVFVNDYGPGMDRFLDSTWFGKKGWTALTHNVALLHQFAHLLDQFRSIPSSDYDRMRDLPSKEASMLWSLFSLCRASPTDIKSETQPETNGTSPPSREEEQLRIETSKRLEIFEHLITNKIAPRNLALDVDYSGTNIPEYRRPEYDFWKNLGHFVSLPDDEAHEQEIDDNLATVRNMLGMVENRDVLYSMMVARHLGPRFPGFPERLPRPPTNDDRDPLAKVWVAKSFIEDESSGKGTTQVIQRMCSVCCRAWQLSR